MNIGHQNFFKRLTQHDWFYMMADDNTSYRAGVAAEQRLTLDAHKDPLKQQMLNAWFEWRNSTIGSSERKPRPELSEFEVKEAA